MDNPLAYHGARTPGEPQWPDDPRRWGQPPQHPSEPWRTPSGQPDAPLGAEALTPWLEERLFDKRIVVLQGPLTGPTATQAAAALIALDAQGNDPIQLRLASPDGELAAAFAVVDALDTIQAPVRGVVTSLVGGAAVGVLVACGRRQAYRHSRIRLSEPRAATVSGTAEQVAAAAGQYLRELEELAVRVAEVTGQPRSRVEDDLATGRILDAGQAQEYGLVDEVIGGLV